MQPLAQKFIQLLESKQLLSDEVILEIRRQVAESKVKLSPELIAKLLVDNGHLTKFQATKLIAELAAQGTASGGSQSGTVKGEDELGFAPVSNVAEVILDDDGDDEIVGVEAVSVIEDAVPIVGAAEVVESVEAVDVVSAFEFGGSSASSSGPVSLSSVPVERARPVRPVKSSSNPWDSFRILGVGVILSLILVAGFFLIRWMVRGSAEDAIKRADDNYEQRSYETAAGMYKDFYTAWGTNEKASYAKVKEALSLLRRDVEGASPINALRTAEEKLPPISEETALIDQQSDLAGALVALAEKFNTRMDGSKDTNQRKELMSEMDKLMGIINDPKFVGSSQRTAQAPTLLKIEESRARILREIRRDDELVVAIREMDQLLEAKDVLKAYEVRKELINRYPLLEANEELNKLVRRASDTQRELVKDANASVKVVADATADPVRSILFAHRDGDRTITELENTFIYYKVKGSVYAIHAANGEVLWSKFVGAGLDSNPVRLDDSPSSDVLVTEAQAGKLHRMAGENGASKWSLDFAEPILPPVVDKEDLVIATYSGKIFSLDAVSGQTKWVKQLPQPVNVSPCVASGKKQIYQPADHSNLYVLDRQNGSCSEVYYLGHRQNGLKVPLVLVQGLLFAVENISNDSARIRILQPSSEGTKSAQGAIAIEGNVIASPVVDRTRLLVQSDIGNTIVLDVESNNTKEKVSKIASIPKNLDTPKLTWTAFSQNFVWLAESRLARFDLVVSQGKLNRKYSHHEGDQFVAPMQLYGKTLFHARRLQGNQGVRICAAGVDDGVKIWELDLGEPVETIIRKQKGFATITSSGNYYNLNGSKPLVSRADVAPSNGTTMKWFDHPVWLTPTQAVFLNRSNAREFALYSEGASPMMRVLAVPLGSAVPSCEAVVAGDKIVVGLDNGQLVMFDPITGALLGSPYQPALKPNARVKWNKPVFLPDNKSLIVASDLNRIVRLDAKDTLRQLSEETLESSLIGPLALIGNTVVGVRGGGSGDELVTFNATSLAQSKGFALEGKLVAGPFSGAETGLIQSSRKLSAITAEGKTAWSVDFPESMIVGEPLLSKGYYLIATRNGVVWNVDVSNGQINGNVSVGQPLSTPPMEVDGRVFVGSDEGVILAISTPTTITVGDKQ